MIIKVLLSFVLLFLLCFVLSQRVTSRGFRFITTLFLLIGYYFIWFPDSSSVVSNFLGVGRGADLILYFWIIISFAGFLMFYLQLQQLLAIITKLARSIALARPVIPDGSKGDHKKSDR